MDGTTATGEFGLKDMRGRVPITIVAYRNSKDVLDCVVALGQLSAITPIEIFICENGGEIAFRQLIELLSGSQGPCELDGSPSVAPPLLFAAAATLRMKVWASKSEVKIHIGCARENLGYAGGINAWLRPLLGVTGWPGVWVLNPDTVPESRALAELIKYAEGHRRGMVGSRLTPHSNTNIVIGRGLKWRKWLASPELIDWHASASNTPPSDEVDSRIDAPSGASIYVTRECLGQVGLMEEHHFLYYEDLDWGIRAKRFGAIGYAHSSVVRHKAGTTTGSSSARGTLSSLSAYLEFRNSVNFVRANFPGWLPWTVAILPFHIGRQICRGQFRSVAASVRGLIAGLLGRTGRPDHMMRSHSPGAGKNKKRLVRQYVKVGISLCYFIARSVAEVWAQLWRRAQNCNLTILYYHGVPDGSVVQFEQQMQMLVRHVQFVAADWNGNEQFDSERRSQYAVAITFDDAFESVFRNALPVLAKYNIPCTIFVPIGVLGKYPQWETETFADVAERVASQEEIASQLSGGLVDIGSHSVTHPHMTTLSDEAARMEVEQSKLLLSELFGIDIRLLAFPYGDFDNRVVSICQDVGYQHVFTIRPKSVELGRNTFVRGRVAVDPSDGPMEFYLKATGCYHWLGRDKA